MQLNTCLANVVCTQLKLVRGASKHRLVTFRFHHSLFHSWFGTFVAMSQKPAPQITSCTAGISDVVGASSDSYGHIPCSTDFICASYGPIHSPTAGKLSACRSGTCTCSSREVCVPVMHTFRFSLGEWNLHSW